MIDIYNVIKSMVLVQIGIISYLSCFYILILRTYILDYIELFLFQHTKEFNA